MATTYPVHRVIVMAKAPLAGLAKTRLIPALGAAGAAALAERLLVHAVQQALAAGIGPVELCLTPDGAPPPAALQASAALAITGQGEGDLGRRMQRAIERALAGAPAGVLLMGTDAPTLDAPMLRRAAAALNTHDAVFVPAHDGGYVLVGLRRAVPQIFQGMTWSTAGVMAQTRARLAAAGVPHIELAPVHDIDEAADLRHLPAGWLVSLSSPTLSAPSP